MRRRAIQGFTAFVIYRHVFYKGSDAYKDLIKESIAIFILIFSKDDCIEIQKKTRNHLHLARESSSAVICFIFGSLLCLKKCTTLY